MTDYDDDNYEIFGEEPMHTEEEADAYAREQGFSPDDED
jgi:hypothetical protein